MTETVLTVHPFEMGTPKETALKPLEEAAEVYAAFQILDKYEPCDWEPWVEPTKEYMKLCIADEIADCIQACCNMAARYDIDMQAAMVRCEERNRNRGMYES